MYSVSNRAPDISDQQGTVSLVERFDREGNRGGFLLLFQGETILQYALVPVSIRSEKSDRLLLYYVTQVA